jgi:hypothetical protein
MPIGTLDGAAGEAIRAARPANDNAPPTKPIVRGLRRRPGTTYASAGNVILPMRFAQRMPGWQRS